jgi:hypothetical protein
VEDSPTLALSPALKRVAPFLTAVAIGRAGFGYSVHAVQKNVKQIPGGSDFGMKTLSVRERVRLEGRSGEYLVVWVDRERHVADLITTTGGMYFEEDVPFSAILDARGIERVHLHD